MSSSERMKKDSGKIQTIAQRMNKVILSDGFVRTHDEFPRYVDRNYRKSLKHMNTLPNSVQVCRQHALFAVDEQK